MSTTTPLPKQKRRRTQSERRADADARMVGAAVDIIAEKGVGGLILSDVAARAGYSATLPVHYYGNKDALLLHTAKFILAEYNAVIQKELAGCSGLDAIVCFIKAYFRYAKENVARRRAFFMITSEAAVHPILREDVASLTRTGASELAKLIRDGQHTGQIEPLIDADVYSLLILGNVRGAISLWSVDPALDLERISAAMIGSAVRALRDRDFLRMPNPQDTDHRDDP